MYTLKNQHLQVHYFAMQNINCDGWKLPKNQWKIYVRAEWFISFKSKSQLETTQLANRRGSDLGYTDIAHLTQGLKLSWEWICKFMPFSLFDSYSHQSEVPCSLHARNAQTNQKWPKTTAYTPTNSKHTKPKEIAVFTVQKKLILLLSYKSITKLPRVWKRVKADVWQLATLERYIFKIVLPELICI